MKRFFAFTLIFALLLGLCACGGDPAETTKSTADSKPVVDSNAGSKSAQGKDNQSNQATRERPKENGFQDGKEHSIDIRVMIKENSTVLRIRDNCHDFDPVKYLELHKNDDPAAHIGIRMVMKLVKSANYVYSLGLNNLTLTL